MRREAKSGSFLEEMLCPPRAGQVEKNPTVGSPKARTVMQAGRLTVCYAGQG